MTTKCSKVLAVATSLSSGYLDCPREGGRLAHALVPWHAANVALLLLLLCGVNTCVRAECDPPVVDYKKIVQQRQWHWPYVTALDRVCVDQETFIVYDAEVIRRCTACPAYDSARDAWPLSCHCHVAVWPLSAHCLASAVDHLCLVWPCLALFGRLVRLRSCRRTQRVRTSTGCFPAVTTTQQSTSTATPTQWPSPPPSTGQTTNQLLSTLSMAQNMWQALRSGPGCISDCRLLMS